MPINVTMPALSPTMEEGNLVKWLVKAGDKGRADALRGQPREAGAAEVVEAVKAVACK
jgi:pyruvate dehydrogenase E2 component (dihydrolipoamide acetyltransferase)